LRLTTPLAAADLGATVLAMILCLPARDMRESPDSFRKRPLAGKPVASFFCRNSSFFSRTGRAAARPLFLLGLSGRC
jgi:hypothetical protein